ncbi:hypothetical protein AgCh_020248 [Apium graveolens]
MDSILFTNEHADAILGLDDIRDVQPFSPTNIDPTPIYFTRIAMDRESQQDIYNAIGSMYVTVLFIRITNASSVQPIVYIERSISYRERATGMYSASFEQNLLKIVWYIYFMYFTLLYFTFFGMMTIVVTPNQNIAPAKTIPKEKSEYTAEDISSISKDAKVRHLLHSAIDNVMSNRVIHCKTTKEICDALETRCQGTDAIKKNRRTILTQEYEHFDSKSDESLTTYMTALPEIWDLKATIIRDNYALDETTLDKFMAEEEFPKVAVSKKGKGKAPITKSDLESSSSDDDDSETKSLPEIDADEEIMKLCALMVKGITKIAYRKFRRGKKFFKKGGNTDKKGFRKYEGKNAKSDRGDNSKVKCYNCGEKGHISPDCKKGKSDKGKALVIKKKSWTESLDSEDEVDYVLMANADGSPETAELKPKVNPVKFVAKTIKSNSEKMKETVTEVKEKSTSDKLEQDKPAEVNIDLMTKKQLKHKLKEIRNVNKVKAAMKNRNGKEGVNKSNNYMPVPNAPRKKCYNCGNSNHIASFCRKNKNINSLPPKSGVKSQSVRFKPQNPCFHCGSLWNSIDTCKEYHSLYYDYYEIKHSLKKVALIPSSVKSDAKSDISSDKQHGNRKNILVLDSGCSGHMTGNKALLSDFMEKAGPGVSYGDGNMGKTLGYGNINLGNIIIETVALVSGLKYNLLSVSQICDRGYHVDFFEEHCEVVSNSTSKVVLKGYRHGNIYEARLSTSSDGSAICLMSRASIEESWNWHKRLSHLNFNNINELVKKDLVRGLPKSVFAPDSLCDSCQKEKQRKSSFKSKTESSILEPYHLLHVDLFGPVNVMYIAKKKYALVIVDEFTRYTWVYFLHKKNEIAFTVTDHVRQLDKLVKDSVKIIRSDNGTEFKNSIMEEFCKEHRIK